MRGDGARSELGEGSRWMVKGKAHHPKAIATIGDLVPAAHAVGWAWHEYMMSAEGI